MSTLTTGLAAQTRRFSRPDRLAPGPGSPRPRPAAAACPWAAVRHADPACMFL